MIWVFQLMNMVLYLLIEFYIERKFLISMNIKKIIENNQQYVKNLIKTITNTHNNEDIEQEVYIKLWKNHDKYEENGKFKSWIKTITLNATKDFLKSKQIKQSNMSVNDEDLLKNIHDTKSHVENKIINLQTRKQIINAIENLSKNHKEVIILYEFYNLSYEDIAKKLSCPLGTIKSRIYTAKKILAQNLKDLI